MTTIVAPIDTSAARARAALPPLRIAGDIALLAGRNLKKVLRNRALIFFTTVQPLLQLVLFAYVFGSIAQLGGNLNYKDFVVPAVIIQTMVFTGMQAGIGIANDLNTGMIDRFRSLPIARSAFLLGRLTADGARLTLQAISMTIMGLIIGFRYHAGIASLVAMVIVVIMWGLALNTFSAFVGLSVRDPETTQAAVFIPLLPLIFTSSAFAPISRLPGWMQPLARNNPITAAIDTARGLALGDDRLYQISHVHLSSEALRFGLEWLLIVGVFGALAIRRYKRA
jgi:ABC-2 type transport system permease protein/oleandomycin transport system permease protein